VIIEDRGVPVARLDPVFGLPGDDDGRLARLERAGLARRPERPVPRSVFRNPPPRPSRDARLSWAVLAEREEGR
jgi:hypothetical protein